MKILYICLIFLSLQFVFIAVLVVVSAQHGDHHHHHLEEYVDYQAHPHYNYHYGVHDPKHHDVHDQWEHRDGKKVKGSYSLNQPDGRKRIVEYESDGHGIHYNVKYEGHAIHDEGHHGHGHGHSTSHQYAHAATNYHGHEGGDGHHGH